MTQSAVNVWTPPTSIATATVKSVDGARIGVESASFGTASARIATFGAYRPRAGDIVLVASAEGGLYVIGVVVALRETEKQITAEDGSSAALEHDEEGAVWRLRDREGALVFEHRPDKSVVHVKHDLELSAGGDLVLEAAGQVRIAGGERIGMSSHGAVELSSQESTLRLDGDRARVTTPLLELESARADVKLGEANFVAETLRTAIHRVRERVELVEREAGRIVERAREVYREVEGLSQTKAGRLKLVADEALSLLGRQTTVQAREDVKVKGEKIYLG